MNTDPQPFLGAAAGVLWWQVVLAVVVGATIGAGSAWFAVFIEKREKLEAEEDEEHREYDNENAATISRATAEGEDVPEFPAWQGERYGWTWLEKFLVPGLTAGLFGLFTFHQGMVDAANHLNTTLLIRLFWVAVLVHILSFDVKHRLILNVITYPAVPVALALAPFTANLGFMPALAGCVICALFFLVFSLISKGGIGLGDAKLGAVIGAIGGFDLGQGRFNAIYALTYGVFLGGATAMLLLVTRVRGLKDPIPYGPFLCAGAALILYTN